MIGEYHEQLRKQRIMQDVLPDQAMWDAWKKTDSKARQGKGFNPNLDKCFLEFLVSTEIDSHSFAHDVDSPLPTERAQRNVEKVRRVAQIRIGYERLEAYRARVKEAFLAYVESIQNWNEWDGASSKSSISSGSAIQVGVQNVDTKEEPELQKMFEENRTGRGRDSNGKRANRGTFTVRKRSISSTSSTDSESSCVTPRAEMAMGDTFLAKDESACAQDRNSLGRMMDRSDCDDYDMTQMIVDGVVDIGAKRLSA